MLVGKGRGIPLTSCWHSPPPRTPSSPRASSLQSSAAPSPGSSGCVFPQSPSQAPLWNDGAPPSSRVLTCLSWSIAGGSHPHASPDVYGTRGQIFPLLLPLSIRSCVRSSFHQILHLTERKTRFAERLEAEHFVSTANSDHRFTPSNERICASWRLCTLH